MKEHKLKPACFLINLEVWDADVLVVSDVEPLDLPKRLTKLKYPKSAAKDVYLEYAKFAQDKNRCGSSVEIADGFQRTHAIFLKDANDSWPFWDVVIHEAHHKTLDITRNKSANLEYEASAFTQVAIIRAIRRGIKPFEKI